MVFMQQVSSGEPVTALSGRVATPGYSVDHNCSRRIAKSAARLLDLAIQQEQIVMY